MPDERDEARGVIFDLVDEPASLAARRHHCQETEWARHALQPELRAARLRSAIERFERQTGRRIADEFPGDTDPGILGVFLIVNGYDPLGVP